METDRVIYRQDLYKALGITSKTLWVWIKSGRIPQADINITQRTVGWRLSTLHAAGIRVL